MSLGTSGQEPSKIKPECASEESFLGDALSERNRDRTGMKAVSLKLVPCRILIHNQTSSAKSEGLLHDGVVFIIRFRDTDIFLVE
jgi:hypothetical protein